MHSLELRLLAPQSSLLRSSTAEGEIPWHLVQPCQAPSSQPESAPVGEVSGLDILVWRSCGVALAFGSCFHVLASVSEGTLFLLQGRGQAGGA